MVSKAGLFFYLVFLRTCFTHQPFSIYCSDSERFWLYIQNFFKLKISLLGERIKKIFIA